MSARIISLSDERARRREKRERQLIHDWFEFWDMAARLAMSAISTAWGVRVR